MKQHPDQENANIREIQRGTEDPSDHETGAQTESRERKDRGVSEWTHEDIISAFKHERDRAFTANRTCRELRDQLSAVTRKDEEIARLKNELATLHAALGQDSITVVAADVIRISKELAVVTAELAWTKDGKFEFSSELDLARTQRNKFRADRDTSLEAIKAWTKRAAIAETERDTARESLRRFGRHDQECFCIRYGAAVGDKCTCGFAAALEDCK